MREKKIIDDTQFVGKLLSYHLTRVCPLTTSLLPTTLITYNSICQPCFRPQLKTVIYNNLSLNETLVRVAKIRRIQLEITAALLHIQCMNEFVDSWDPFCLISFTS